MNNDASKTNTEQNRAQITAQLSAEIICAYVSNNTLPASELPVLLTNINTAMTNLVTQVGDKNEEETEQTRTPAVPIKKSIKPDMLTCLECGLEFKSLKKHLRASHDLSPEEYRKRWGLPSDYPMVASAYAERRSELAKRIGLGRKS
ncbi:MAG: MucR family transcriptional regulator [Hyphomicrobiales bacterium]